VREAEPGPSGDERRGSLPKSESEGTGDAGGCRPVPVQPAETAMRGAVAMVKALPCFMRLMESTVRGTISVAQVPWVS